MTSIHDPGAEFDLALEAAAAARGWTSREGIAFDPATGAVSDAVAWELEAERTEPIAPTAIRYVRLGVGGAWFDRCLTESVVELGHEALPHQLAMTGDWDAVRSHYAQTVAKPQVVSNYVRELKDFYTLPETTLWVTLRHGRLWWAFADATVTAIEEEGRGARIRRVIGGWRSTDIQGRPLLRNDLSTRLTQVEGFQGTICSVSEPDYLVRRINGMEEPAIARAQAAKRELVEAAADLIQGLDWRDFELMTDLIFAGSGWKRVSAVGGSGQVDTDLVMTQAATGERAEVQVKSKATQAVLDRQVDLFEASQADRLFFICHSPPPKLRVPEDRRVHVWLRNDLAEQAVAAGLLDWLIEKRR